MKIKIPKIGVFVILILTNINTFPQENIKNIEPEIFEPGIINTGMNERDAAFTPDGNRIYFTIWSGSFGTIVFSDKINGKWNKPKVAKFSGLYSDLEPFITHDGKRLFFVSNRGNVENKDYDIWFMKLTDSGWSSAERLPDFINTKGNEFYPSVAKNGDLYFTAKLEESYGDEDIYCSKLLNGEYQNPENLGKSINTKLGEFNSLIAPDESYIIFSSYGRDDDKGGGDLYISFKKGNVWQNAINMKEINSTSLDYCPALSPDGKTFYFTSRRMESKNLSNLPRAYKQLYEQTILPGNGNSDIYSIPSKVITEFYSKIKE